MDKLDDIDFEKLMKMADLFMDNKDKIFDVIERIPLMLKETGDTMEAAGNSAMKASTFLVGGQKGKPSAKEVSELAADALERCYKEIAQVAKFMDELGDDLDKINIPNIKPRFIEALGHKVVSGIELGEDQLFDNAAGKLQDGSRRLGTIGGDLSAVAKHLRGLGATLADAGTDLNVVGEKLKQGGTTLKGVTAGVGKKK
jgi:hypothetical protein